MDRVEPDESASAAWEASLDATCNRLLSHYSNLLRAASSSANDRDASSSAGSSAAAAVVANGGSSSAVGAAAAVHGANQVGADPRAGGGPMSAPDDPPPPLAANVLRGAVQAKLAAENLCVASSSALDLIRTLRLSALLMDEELIEAEEEEEALGLCEAALEAEAECAALEERLRRLRGKS